MSQMNSEAVASTYSLNISGVTGSGFITLQPQTTPPLKPVAGCNIYSDGNNNLAWKNAQGNVFTLNTMTNTTSRTWTMPDQSGELVTLDSLSIKEDKAKKGIPLGYASLGEDGKVPSEQLPSSISGFAPSVVSVLYASCTITSGNTVQVRGLTTVPPAVFSSLPGFQPSSESNLSADIVNGDFAMDTLDTIYEFKIDTHWSQNAETGERRTVSLIPLNGDLNGDQVTRREELGLILNTYGQTISLSTFVHVYVLGSSGGFNSTLELSAPNATSDRTVDIRIRVIRWK